MSTVCDLTRYKVVYKDSDLRALTLMEVCFSPEEWPEPDAPGKAKPQYITVLTINADGVLEALTGKAEEFQFVPILNIQ